jgi:hypothetical protein
MAHRLNAEGHPSRTGKPWVPETVRQIAMRGRVIRDWPEDAAGRGYTSDSALIKGAASLSRLCSRVSASG